MPPTVRRDVRLTMESAPEAEISSQLPLMTALICVCSDANETFGWSCRPIATHTPSVSTCMTMPAMLRVLEPLVLATVWSSTM